MKRYVLYGLLILCVIFASIVLFQVIQDKTFFASIFNKNKSVTITDTQYKVENKHPDYIFEINSSELKKLFREYKVLDSEDKIKTLDLQSSYKPENIVISINSSTIPQKNMLEVFYSGEEFVYGYSVEDNKPDFTMNFFLNPDKYKDSTEEQILTSIESQSIKAAYNIGYLYTNNKSPSVEEKDVFLTKVPELLT